MISDEKPTAEDASGEARRVSVLKKLVGLRRNNAVAFLGERQADPRDSPVWRSDLSMTLTILRLTAVWWGRTRYCFFYD